MLPDTNTLWYSSVLGIRHERIAHGRSLKWAILSERAKSEERRAKERIPNPGIHTFHSRIVYMFVTLLQRFLVWNFNRTDKIFICSLIVFLCIFVSIYLTPSFFFYKKLSSFNASMVWKAVCSALRQEVNHRGNTKAVG